MDLLEIAHELNGKIAARLSDALPRLTSRGRKTTHTTNEHNRNQSELQVMGNHSNRSNRNPKPDANPAPADIIAAREAAGLTQTEAAALVHSALRTWQQWEAEAGTDTHRRMHPGLWELFLIKTAAKRG